MYSLCLGGGGAKGAYQVGVLKALKEFDISIAAISGSSIGALNGLFYLGCDIEKIEEGWLNLSKEDFLSIDDDNLLNGICGRQGLIDTINKYVDFDRFYNSKILLFASVVNGDQISYVLLNKLTKEQKKLFEELAKTDFIFLEALTRANEDNTEEEEDDTANNNILF